MPQASSSYTYLYLHCIKAPLLLRHESSHSSLILHILQRNVLQDSECELTYDKLQTWLEADEIVNDERYSLWLEGVVPISCQPGKSVHIKELSADSSNKVGWRSVNRASIRAKAELLFQDCLGSRISYAPMLDKFAMGLHVLEMQTLDLTSNTHGVLGFLQGFPTPCHI